MDLETGQPPHFPAEPIISPQMEHLDWWCARSKIPLPSEIPPEIKHRMISSMPELATGCPNDEWMYTTIGGSLVFLSETGPKKDSQRALASLSILREIHPAQVRAGRSSHPICIGDQMVCIDYSFQVVSIGELSWLSVDFGGNLPLGGKLRTAYLKERRSDAISARYYA